MASVIGPIEILNTGEPVDMNLEVLDVEIVPAEALINPYSVVRRGSITVHGSIIPIIPTQADGNVSAAMN